MKKVITIISMLMMVFAFTGCGSLDEQGQQCLDDIKIGLQNRWDFTNAEYSTYEEYADNISKGIDAELKVLSEYKDVQFEDESFNKIIKDYIQALESQKEGITYMFTDVPKFNDLFVDNGLKARSEYMNLLDSDYGFSVDSGYEESYKTLLDGSYIPSIASKEQVKVNTDYGEVGVSFIGFDVLTEYDGEKVFALLCEVENISYYDEYNSEIICLDNFISLYDGEGYSMTLKNSTGVELNGYDTLAGAAAKVLREGEKKRYAIIYDYTEDYNILYAVAFGTVDAYGCYLNSN